MLKKAVDSVLQQTYTEFEILIIDDGSTDDTKEVIEKNYSADKRVKYIYQQNSERAAARNNGVSNASGAYVNFFDSDDILYPNHLEEAAKFLKENKAGAFHLNYEMKNKEGQFIKRGPDMKNSANEKLIRGNFLSCNGVFLGRELALKFPFNTDRVLSGMEDWELWLRIASNVNISMIDTVTSCIIDHDQRSVLSTEKEKLIHRVNTLMKLVCENPVVSKKYSDELHIFRSSCLSYIALHLALTKKYRKETFRYTMKSFSEYPLSIFNRRSFAIIKHFFN